MEVPHDKEGMDVGGLRAFWLEPADERNGIYNYFIKNGKGARMELAVATRCSHRP
jgi:hypothetical protein